MTAPLDYRLGQIEARLETLTEQQRQLHQDVRLLLDAHAAQRGAIKVLVALSALVSTVVSFIIGLFRH